MRIDKAVRPTQRQSSASALQTTSPDRDHCRTCAISSARAAESGARRGNRPVANPIASTAARGSVQLRFYDAAIKAGGWVHARATAPQKPQNCATSTEWLCSAIPCRCDHDEERHRSAKDNRHGQRSDAAELPLRANRAGWTELRARVPPGADATGTAASRRVRRQVHDRLQARVPVDVVPGGQALAGPSRIRRSTASASMPVSRSRCGARRDGSMPTIRGAGSSGTAGTTWGGDCRMRMLARSSAGK